MWYQSAYLHTEVQIMTTVKQYTESYLCVYPKYPVYTKKWEAKLQLSGKNFVTTDTIQIKVQHHYLYC